MISNELKSRVNKLWENFWSGGITNPLTVIEQITFLMFIRLLDIREQRETRKAAIAGREYKGFFAGREELRWSHFKNLYPDDMLIHVRDQVFPSLREVVNGDSILGRFMRDAQLMIQKPGLLQSAVDEIDRLPLEKDDVKGDLYEYLLSKLTTAGIAGQFRTPRHIIELMVRIADPAADERIADPAMGTAGFLVQSLLYIFKKYSSPAGIIEQDDGSLYYSGDLLEPHLDHVATDLLHGYEFDSSMLRIGAMNLLLHGIDNPAVRYQDSLSGAFAEKYPDESENYYDVILANPPFKGTIDMDVIDESLTARVKTKKSELLFIVLMLRMLRVGGRCAVIVPDGVLFGASKAHVSLRKALIEENQLEGIISLPSGVFKPYAGVSTAIVIFTKGGATENVWFYDVQADGYSLDDKRTPVEQNDLPDALKKWKQRDPQKDNDRTQKNFFVPADEIRENNYDLSINRYKEIVYEEEEYEEPQKILNNIKNIETEIQREISELESMLK